MTSSTCVGPVSRQVRAHAWPGRAARSRSASRTDWQHSAGSQQTRTGQSAVRERGGHHAARESARLVSEARLPPATRGLTVRCALTTQPLELAPEDTDLERISLGGPRIRYLRDLFVIDSGARSRITNSLCVKRVRVSERLNTAESRWTFWRARYTAGPRRIDLAHRPTSERNTFFIAITLAERGGRVATSAVQGRATIAAASEPRQSSSPIFLITP